MTNRKKLKRIVLGASGGIVLAVGLAMIVLPGPAFIVLPAGLAILAIEFEWARRWLKKAKSWFAKAKAKVHRDFRKSSA